MATPMEEEVQGSSPAMAEEGGSPNKPVVELPAPEGWKKKLIPRKRRDDIVYITPTGEEIKSRTQLDRYLKSHPGGPPSSEFHWGTGTTPRRSSRLTEKIQAESQTPESESKKTPKRSRKSDVVSEDTKSSSKRRKSEENEEDKEVDKDESMKEDTLEETTIDDKSGKEEEVKPEEQDDKVEGSKAEDVEMQETVETGEGKEVPVEEDKVVMKEPEDYAEDVKVGKESEVGEEKPNKEPEVEEEKAGKEFEGEEENPSKEPEVQSEEKSEKEPEAQSEANPEKEPEVNVPEYSAANDHEINLQEEAKKDVVEEEKSDNKGTYENGVDTEPKLTTHAEPQEPLDVKNENGHSGNVLQGHSVEPVKEMSDDSKAKYTTSDAPRTEELQSSNSSAPQQPSEQLGTSS